MVDEPGLFGTDGIRGLYGAPPIDGPTAFSLGRAVVEYLKGEAKNILIGMDTRYSGPLLREYLAGGIEGGGGVPLGVGVITTPGLAFATRSRGCAMGVMVSASHNAAVYNGFKVFNASGIKLRRDEELKLEGLILGAMGNALPYKAKILEDMDVKVDYINFLKKNAPDLKGPLGLKLCVDCANGSTSFFAKELYHEIGLSAEIFNSEPDGQNINDSCGSEEPAHLAEVVRTGLHDLGICFDGDGDRIVVIDEKGEVLAGEQLLYILAKMLKEKGLLKTKRLVTTIMSNSSLAIALAKEGIETIETDVGDRNVYYEMINQGANFGGEESGHIIFLDHHTTGDGLLTSLKVLEAIAHFKRPLSELKKEVRPFPKVSRKLEVRAKVPILEIPLLTKAINRAKEELRGRGKVVVRYSGTEPVLRIMVEGEDLEKIRVFCEEIYETALNHLAP